MHLWKSLGDAYRVLRPECALAPTPKGDGAKGKDAVTLRRDKEESKSAPVLVATGYPPQDLDQGMVDPQGNLLLPATPVMDDHGAVACIAPAGSQFHVNETDGRRAPYVQTTGYTPMSENSRQPMPTWAVRAEAPPQVADRPYRLREYMFLMTQGPKAYHGPGNGLPGRTPRSCGPATMRPPGPGGPAGCMLCKYPQHWVSSCPLIPKEARRVAAQRKGASGGHPLREPYRSNLSGSRTTAAWGGDGRSGGSPS